MWKIIDSHWLWPEELKNVEWATNWNGIERHIRMENEEKGESKSNKQWITFLWLQNYWESLDHVIIHLLFISFVFSKK